MADEGWHLEWVSAALRKEVLVTRISERIGRLLERHGLLVGEVRILQREPDRDQHQPIQCS